MFENLMICEEAMITTAKTVEEFIKVLTPKMSARGLMPDQIRQFALYCVDVDKNHNRKVFG